MRENNWAESETSFSSFLSNEIFRQNIVFPPLIPFSKSPVSYHAACLHITGFHDFQSYEIFVYLLPTCAEKENLKPWFSNKDCY